MIGNTIRFVLLFLCIELLASCSSTTDNPSTDEPLQSIENLFFAYDFTLEDLSRAERADFLKENGYQGVLFPYGSQAYKEYEEALKEINPDSFSIPAVYYHHKMGVENAEWRWQNIVNLLANKPTKLLFIVSNDGEKEINQVELQSLFERVADHADTLNVDVVIYPHHGTLINASADALPIVQKASRKNLSLSLHLCHELRAGNGEKLNEIVAQMVPYTTVATINGADFKSDPNKYQIWGDLIKPLYKGNFDAGIFLNALVANGYKGPIALHTYGLKESYEKHYPKSMEKWKILADKAARQ